MENTVRLGQETGQGGDCIGACARGAHLSCPFALARARVDPIWCERKYRQHRATRSVLGAGDRICVRGHQHVDERGQQVPQQIPAGVPSTGLSTVPAVRLAGGLSQVPTVGVDGIGPVRGGQPAQSGPFPFGAAHPTPNAPRRRPGGAHVSGGPLRPLSSSTSWPPCLFWLVTQSST
jgi:hypothetical protein